MEKEWEQDLSEGEEEMQQQEEGEREEEWKQVEGATEVA